MTEALFPRTMINQANYGDLNELRIFRRTRTTTGLRTKLP